MNPGLFISQNLFEGLLKGISCQKVKEGVVCSSLNSAGELKEIYSDFLNMLAEISNCEEMPLSICTSLEEIKELIAIQRFFETKSNEVSQESNSLSVRPLIAQNQKRSYTEKIPDSSKLPDQGANLSQTVESLVEKSGIKSEGIDSLSFYINSSVKENEQFDVQDILSGLDNAATGKQGAKSGDLLKSNETMGIEKLGNIIESGSSAAKTLNKSEDAIDLKIQSVQQLKGSESAQTSSAEIDNASEPLTNLNERVISKGTISTAYDKGLSGQNENVEIAANDLTEMQGLKKEENTQHQANGSSLNKEFTQKQNDQIQTENNFSKVSKDAISVNRELPQEDYVLKDYGNPNVKDGLNPETRALNIAEPLSSGENTSIRNAAVADDETVLVPRTVNMGKPVVTDKGDEANLKSGKSGYDDVEKSNSIPERLIFEDISLKKEKTESKPDNKNFESEMNQGNDPDKAPRLSRFNSNNSSGEQGNMPSKVDYSGREIFSKNEVEIQGPSLKGDKTHEISRIPVDEKSLNNEPDIKDAHVLSSGKNSSEINQSQVSQTKNSDQLQRPLQLDLLNQVVEKAVVNLKNGQTSINIDLKPEYLGRLRMHISTDNNQVVVKVMTDVPLVKEIMETNLSQLKTELQNHGLEIEKFDVFLNDCSNQDSAEHERWLFGKRESGAKEIIKPVSISDEITPLVAFSESGRVNGRIDCMA